MIITQNSQLGNIWDLQERDTSLIATIKTEFKCSLLTAKILANKNLSFDEIATFLNPDLKNSWHTIDEIPNSELAAKILIEIIKNKKKVGIIGDYDVDGICASILLKEFFDEFNITSTIWTPQRKDGYGPNENALKFFKENPVDLLILVDCGTNAHEFKNQYTNEMLIIDHHNCQNPVENTLVNPNASKEKVTDEMKELCATSLCFFVVAHTLKTINYENYQKFMKSITDLVALASVCDMMPFNSLNRALIKVGIKSIEKQERIGLRQLINFANIKFPITSKDISFTIGPRLNATGRIESPEISLNLLKSKELEECDEMIHRIEAINTYRKEIQQTAFREAAKIAKNTEDDILCLASENWNSGIVGIVAAMIQNEEGKPTIIGSIIKDEVKASARSNSINIGMLIERAVELQILEKGGGHKAAAGLTCKLNKWEEFKLWINQQSTLTEKGKMKIDAIITLGNIDHDYRILSPFGLGNEEPKVLIQELRISRIIDKESYHQIYFEENFRSFVIFVNHSKQKLIEELINAFENKQKFSAVFSLPEKGHPMLEDIAFI